MDFDWRIEKKEDFYPTLVKWWKLWEFPVIPLSSLPDDIFVVSWSFYYDKTDITDLYAVPVFRTNSDVCWIGFPTSNKEADKDLKEGALNYLLDMICQVMKANDFRTIITTSGTPKLIKVFEDSGFNVTDTGINFYTKQL